MCSIELGSKEKFNIHALYIELGNLHVVFGLFEVGRMI